MTIRELWRISCFTGDIKVFEYDEENDTHPDITIVSDYQLTRMVLDDDPLVDREIKFIDFIVNQLWVCLK